MKENADLILVTDKVQLVPYREEHVEKYNSWMASEALLEATASERLSMEDELEMQKEWARDPQKCTFIIRDAASSQMIGDCNLFFNDHDDDSACEIECMIAESGFRRRGLAMEAMELFMAYGAVELGVTKFVAKIGFANVASNALFQTKLGYLKRSVSEIFEETTYELAARDASGDVLSRFKSTWARVTCDSYDAFEARRAATNA